MSSANDDETVQAFSRLLVANQRRISGFFLTLVHDRAAAEDIYSGRQRFAVAEV